MDYLLTIRSSNFSPRNIPKRNENICTHKNMYMGVHGTPVIIAKNGNNPNVHQLKE